MKCSSDKTGCKSKCLKIGLLVVAGVLALGWVVMLLWNWLIPELFFGARPVSYCQALGVLLLSKILFGGFRHHGHGHWHERRLRWESMTPEEREQLKGRFGKRWSHWCSTPKPADSSDNTPARPE